MVVKKPYIPSTYDKMMDKIRAMEVDFFLTNRALRNPHLFGFTNNKNGRAGKCVGLIRKAQVWPLITESWLSVPFVTGLTRDVLGNNVRCCLSHDTNTKNIEKRRRQIFSDIFETDLSKERLASLRSYVRPDTPTQKEVFTHRLFNHHRPAMLYGPSWMSGSRTVQCM